jgi:hypothetical protein
MRAPRRGRESRCSGHAQGHLSGRVNEWRLRGGDMGILQWWRRCRHTRRGPSGGRPRAVLGSNTGRGATRPCRCGGRRGHWRDAPGGPTTRRSEHGHAHCMFLIRERARSPSAGAPGTRCSRPIPAGPSPRGPARARRPSHTGGRSCLSYRGLRSCQSAHRLL